jgi:hypothetical protein
VPDPLGGGMQRFRGEAAAVDTAINFALEQARGLEDTEMLGNSRQGEREWLGKLGNCGLTLRETGENAAASGVGEGGERGVERCALIIVNHTVKYRAGRCACQAGFPWSVSTPTGRSNGCDPFRQGVSGGVESGLLAIGQERMPHAAAAC